MAYIFSHSNNFESSGNILLEQNEESQSDEFILFVSVPNVFSSIVDSGIVKDFL